MDFLEGINLLKSPDMLIGVPIFMFLAALGYLIFLPPWLGLNKEWIKERNSGWPPLKGLAIAALFQGAAFGMLAEAFMPRGADGSTPLGDALYLVAGFHFFIVVPIALWGMYLPLPKFLLPRWIREYLRVRQENPHYDSLSEIENSRPVVNEGLGTQSFPITVRVQVVRWLISGILCLGLGIASLWIFIGVVSGSMELGGGITRLGWPLLSISGAFLILLGLYFVWGGLRPEHVTIDQSGLRTRSWCLDWSEIKGIESSRSKVIVHVTPAVAERIRPVNRWHSGRPGGVGGMLAVGDTVGLQSSLANPDGVISIVEYQLSRRGSPLF
ncbi:hypothetical protein [Kocuria sp.]|uniref:hypothetical protein n=1 Tax=Kocuria sp. TaxID=1871328 RepID=UPI0026DED971|nr:hypothetical protein [Kocuria sp.]MDO5618754.1 hypothetical protein [Kocuria sp.]